MRIICFLKIFISKPEKIFPFKWPFKGNHDLFFFFFKLDLCCNFTLANRSWLCDAPSKSEQFISFCYVRVFDRVVPLAKVETTFPCSFILILSCKTIHRLLVQVWYHWSKPSGLTFLRWVGSVIQNSTPPLNMLANDLFVFSPVIHKSLWKWINQYWSCMFQVCLHRECFTEMLYISSAALLGLQLVFK